MHFEKRSYMHIKLTDFQYKALENLAIDLNIPISKLINILIPKLKNFINKELDLTIDYSKYLTLIDKVDGDKERILSPHISLTRENHIFLRNIKNRNFRVSFAMLIRLLIEELIIKGEKETTEERCTNYSPIFYSFHILLTPEIQLITPLPEETLSLLL